MLEAVFNLGSCLRGFRKTVHAERSRELVCRRDGFFQLTMRWLRGKMLQDANALMHDGLVLLPQSSDEC